MDILEHSALIEKKARYYTVGNPEKSDHLLIVLHGYGQLAKYFIHKFKGLDENIFVVAIEGLHRFYLNGTSGRVGASWMTKEAREDDIADTQKYLMQMLTSLQETNKFQKTTLLGFSQGGATAARFFFSESVSIDHLILWATVFPPDLLIENEVKAGVNKTQKRSFVIGDEDQFFDAAVQRDLIAFYEEKHFETCHFKGRHDIDFETLKTILR